MFLMIVLFSSFFILPQTRKKYVGGRTGGVTVVFKTYVSEVNESLNLQSV